MAYNGLKAEVIANAAVGLLTQELLATGMFWKHTNPSFVGAKDDTITLRLPAYGVATETSIRTPGAVTFSDLHERSIDIKLDRHIYHGISLSDAQLTLDITNFGSQILSPQTDAVARALEAKAVTTMTGATYANTVEILADDVLAALREARSLLNKANVPMSQRYVALGADIEAVLLADPKMNNAAESGSTSVLRQATIGNLYGFQLVSVPTLPVGVAIAFHTTAFAMSTMAPAIPSGVTFGQSASSGGVSMRWIRDYSDALLSDRSLVDLYCGTSVVTDNGHLDATTRVFTPSVDPAEVGAADVFVRAVKIVDAVAG